MAEPTRLAKLPGYDTAPDVYETPETATDTSTITTSTTNETPSDSATSEDESLASDEDGPFGGISHRRLFPERARSRFQSQGGRVEVKGLDLSDRVDGRRRGLQVRLRRTGADGNEETLEARIARLRKEVEECRVLAEERDAEAEGVAVHELGKMLIELEAADKPSIPAVEEQKNLPPIQEQSAEDIVPLAKIAAFDARLTGLERAVGISSMDIDADGSFTAPVLPSLSLLDQQISALMTSTSIAQLDAASTRIRKLAQEADRLAQPQGPADADDDAVKDTMAFTQDERTKLGGLYALLPSLQGLSPTVPAVIERLRSLTALHSGAANAASELDAVVKKQADMDAELKSWEAGLERLEGVVKNALEANGRNGKFVEGWVQDLQKRTEALR